MSEPITNGPEDGGERSFTFQPTPAVAASRTRNQYVACPLCQADHSQYLFHKVGVRFVRCRTCGMVYVNPVAEDRVNYFDIDRIGQYARPAHRALAIEGFEEFLQRIAADYERVEGRPLKSALLLGRWLNEFEHTPTAERIGLKIARADAAAFQALARSGDVSWARSELEAGPDVVIMHELLEASSELDALLRAVVGSLPQSSWVVVTYLNSASLPARVMTRYWPPFFNYKTTFFNTDNLTALMARFGLRISGQFPFPIRQTTDYILKKVVPESKASLLVAATPLGSIAAPLHTGQRVATFRRMADRSSTQEKLSIVFPVFNEARYVAQVIEAILAKQLKIDKELIIVESNSTDGTRDIVRTFEGRPGVTVLYEDKPRGKGHAVRTGLKAVKGSIVLIQDADFEYDIDDYDALLEPILQRRTAFVLGSRSLGLDDWKVRRYANSAVKGFLLNSAQVMFAKTFNLLYQQRITDVNTMFKVFRTECLEAFDLECDRFSLDIELACKLVKNGNAPMEVPVNYVSRGFDEGKKISFVRDALPSYWAIFRYRFR